MPVSYTSPQIRSLLAELKELRASCIAMEQEFGASIAEACPQSKRSVQNLLHYLALRKHDLRDLQSRLAALGLSSLGRSESSTLAGLDAVIAILESLAGEQSADPLPLPPYVDFNTGPAILAQQADHLLGPVPKGRAVRVMVTMPPEAAQSYDLVKALVEAGMDVMRVNAPMVRRASGKAQLPTCSALTGNLANIAMCSWIWPVPAAHWSDSPRASCSAVAG
jgi:pyruvate kinase